MFQQSILGDTESRRPWTFSVSLLAQMLLVALAALIPLLSKPMLPLLGAALVALEAPNPPLAAPPPAQQQSPRAQMQPFDPALIQPRAIPDHAEALVDAMSNDTPGIGIIGVPQGLSGNGIMAQFADRVRIAPPPQAGPAVKPEPPARPIPVGGKVQAAKILVRIKPVYPPLAIRTGTSGVVRLRAIIAADGTIAELSVIEGHPLLARAALEAVRQWRYRPTVLNGAPVAVQTQIDVNFKLGR